MSGLARPSPRAFTWIAMLVAWWSAVAPGSPAQERADDDPFLPGLVAVFRDARGNTATRVDHQLSFLWGEGPPDPRLVGGEFHATWQGRLLVEDRGEYRFFVFGTGEVELKVAGKVVLPRQALRDEWRESAPVMLAAEHLPLELSFRRMGKDARLAVFWSGPQFGLEPIPPRFLFHPREHLVNRDFERGQLLARVLRCAGCHAGEPPPPPAPALDRLAGNLSRSWLVRWLTAGEHPAPDQQKREEPMSPRRMPAFGMSAAQAEAIADWLLTPRGPDRSELVLPPWEEPPNEKPAKKGKKAPPPKPRPDAKTGEQLFLTLGCLACHSWRDHGASGWLGGGDLTRIADKRPPGFFAAWLADPARLNRDHRMPVFTLSSAERTSLALFLAAQKSGSGTDDLAPHESAERRAEGRKLVGQFGCIACHRLPEEAGAESSEPRLPNLAKSAPAPRLGEQSNWRQSCLGDPNPVKHRPGYRLSEADARAVRLYYTRRREALGERPVLDGQLLLAEHNCLACHAREGAREAIPLLPPLLTDKLMAASEHYGELAARLPALTPPALNSVGDKLTDQALADAISRRGEPHRPYLQVRMPRFRLRDDELKALVKHLVATDRIPPRHTTRPPAKAQQDRYVLAGGRLVSSDGFGCTSCHQVGRVVPPEVPLNVRGPDLSLLGRRIRREWFDRWVRNPARIVPRMEMPSVQLPVSGVLDDRLDEQLAAVWHVLNLPDFEPPPPNPVRTLRHDGNHPSAEPVIITDLVEHDGRLRVRPFLVGLANRHNVLLDLEVGNLALWTAGDTAWQRTRGKNWYWELAGAPVLDPEITGSDLVLVAGGRELSPQPREQFVAEVDGWQTEGPAVVLHYRLLFAAGGKAGANGLTLQVQRRLAPVVAEKGGHPTGFAQELLVGPLPADSRMRLRVLSEKAAASATRSADGREVRLGDRFNTRIVLREPASAAFSADGTTVWLDPDEKGNARLVLHYLTEVPLDRFPKVPEPPVVRKGEPVEIAPGFRGERLPLTALIMPSGLAWRPDGRLVFVSLKGQVFEAVDTDGDGSEDRLTLLADGLPAPYGINTGPGYVDVSVKYALLRIGDAGNTPSPQPLSPRGGREAGGEGGRRIQVIASGWGYSSDYHDWAVGLPRNERGEYFLGIPCQQDQRPLIAARFHGNVLKLVPRRPTADDPRLFALEPISAGHRFPMGLALDRNGELFVTDNQGNYNPFNELNHVRPGAHFGFINTLDRDKPVPPLTPPAINIPHPWTRSVNGICFLDTPKELRARLSRAVFGPLEGHLIGCEYDTRRLIRMTLQRVGDTFQGAAYPLSIPPRDPARGFMGPIVCAVSPRGELYVGSIRDSGWGAGNNLGEIVRVRIEPDQLGNGIAEVRATADGFTIDFFGPIDRQRAAEAESYTIQSYRRISTPAYGGPDVDRRTEKVTGVAVAPDGRRVTLRLTELRPGFVYEIRLKNLAPGGGDFHPAEAHYTLRVIPK